MTRLELIRGICAISPAVNGSFIAAHCRAGAYIFATRDCNLSPNNNYVNTCLFRNAYRQHL